MERIAWTTPSLRMLRIRSSTQANFPPGGPDSFATSDSLCPSGEPTTGAVPCLPVS